MSRVFYNQPGYAGVSEKEESVHATDELPRSKWTKKAMLAAIREVCDANGLLFVGFENFDRDELFRRYFRCSSWHHTSRPDQEANLYAIDEEVVSWSTRPLTPEEIFLRNAESKQAQKQIAEESPRETAYAAIWTRSLSRTT